MGKNLSKWAGRLCGLYSLAPLAQCVLLRMANAAIDYDAQTDIPEDRRGICYMSREELAQQIYGSRSKAKNLDRAIFDLRRTGMIEPVGLSARKGHAQEYRLGVYGIVAIRAQELGSMYRNDAQELGRIQRNFMPE